MKRTADEIRDELLVFRCQRRDADAWETLVTRWNAPLLFYIRRLVSDEQDAMSILQDVWLKAVRGIQGIRDRQRLAGWLYAIARNSAMSHLRRKFSQPNDDDFCSVDEQPTHEENQFTDCDDADLVHFGLGKLRFAEREVLTLFFLDDLSLREIAEVTGVAIGTVKSRLYHARRSLRRVIEREVNRHEPANEPSN